MPRGKASLFAGWRWAVIFLMGVAALAFGQRGLEVADSLKPQGNQKLVMRGHATGSQIYECRVGAGDGAGGVPATGSWVLAGPEAQLVDDDGKKIADHFAGPTWQATDGSKVKGKVVTQATPNADTIPWLLLTAVEHGGKGAMSDVSSIQRLNTSGGMAPTTTCDTSRRGEKARVSYTADYYFYSPVK